MDYKFFDYCGRNILRPYYLTTKSQFHFLLHGLRLVV